MIDIVYRSPSCMCKSCAGSLCKKEHDMYVSKEYLSHHLQAYRMPLRCNYCPIEITIAIPEYLPRKQVKRYVANILGELNTLEALQAEPARL